MDGQHAREQTGMPEEPERTPLAEQASGDDTAGFVMGAPPAILWRIAPQVALGLTLPDPPPDERIRIQPDALGPR